VHAFLRPEQVHPVRAGGQAVNAVEGVVSAHIYQGSHTITRVQVEGIGTLETRVTGSDIIGEHPVGTAITLALDLNQAVLLPSG